MVLLKSNILFTQETHITHVCACTNKWRRVS